MSYSCSAVHATRCTCSLQAGLWAKAVEFDPEIRSARQSTVETRVLPPRSDRCDHDGRETGVADPTATRPDVTCAGRAVPVACDLC
eukprot:7379437-Prymnesium_polylepis.1